MASFKMPGIPLSYITQAEEVQRGQNAKIQHLLTQVRNTKMSNVKMSLRHATKLLHYSTSGPSVIKSTYVIY